MLGRATSGDKLARVWAVPEHVNDNLDPWQREALFQLITCQNDVLMCCSRGAGKTEVFAAASYVEACTVGGFALILSRSDRQAQRLITRALIYNKRCKLQRLQRETMHELVFANGGRILALPCSADTIIGEHGITLMGIDEAARIKDSFYAVVSPMLSVSEAVTGIKPRQALLSTPFGRSGFFYNEWTREQSKFKRFRTTWKDCPRINPEFIEEERRKHGDWWVQQEYETQFLATENSFFNLEQHAQAVVDSEPRRFGWTDDEVE